MVALTPEDHDILGLRAELEKALATWSSSAREEDDFKRLIPFVDSLVDAKQQILDRQKAARNAVMSRIGGGALVVVAVVLLVLVPGWPTWLFVVSGSALLVGIYLLAAGGSRARNT